ncbi:hypothetical protein L204_103941 [Cryptococcus depauperatus]
MRMGKHNGRGYKWRARRLYFSRGFGCLGRLSDRSIGTDYEFYKRSQRRCGDSACHVDRKASTPSPWNERNANKNGHHSESTATKEHEG